MILLIFRKEFNEIFFSKRFLIIVIGVAVLWFFALFNGIGYYQGSNSSAQQVQNETYQQWLDQGDKNPHSAAHYGFYIAKPIPLLAVIDKGANDFLGNVVWIEAHNQNEVKNPAATDAGSLLRMGQLTIGFVLQFIIPLMIILLCYNLFTKEKENGTIKLLLSTRANLIDLFMGKFLASMLSLWMMLLPLLAFSMLLMYQQDFSESWSLEIIPSMVYFVLGLFLLYTLLIAICISVSLKVNSSSIALVILAGFWLCGVFLVPRFASVLAEQVYPAPTSFAFEQQITDMRLKGIDGHGPVNEDLLKETLDQYGVDSIEDLPVNFAAISLQASEESDAAIYDIVYTELFIQFRQQEKFLSYMGILSPFQTFRNISMALSGTDMQTHLDFAEHAEKHRRAIQKTINDFYLSHDTGSDDLWHSVGLLNYTSPDIYQRLHMAQLDVVVLITWLLLGLGFTYYSVKTFKIV
ncbi:ABC transporter permease subunit [Anditalea andensis]|uniref:ABC transporter permease n=1 Tax=Anditalea andensis TaxID=1048983 RepID=A0A074KWC9_9BACT|nr:ABC transporter permease subunit [Anditalea andensis]KEO71918.1 hypothetical protein EL17_20595 [Anditalea andensis]